MDSLQSTPVEQQHIISKVVLRLTSMDGRLEQSLCLGSSTESLTNLHQNLRCSVETDSWADLLQLVVQPISTTSVVCENVEMSTLFDSFATMFVAPQGLPPSRPHDHFIHRKPGSQPVNIGLSRYPHFQKNEIEWLVTGMLQEAIIQLSNSLQFCWLRRRMASSALMLFMGLLMLLLLKTVFPFRWLMNYWTNYMVSNFALNWICGRVIIKVAFILLTFHATMNAIFRPFLSRFVLVFFEEILIYSQSWTSPLQHFSRGIAGSTD
ncbi:uncharacterized protein LOC122076566 isoform X1 [Macadamia integrifolia]|uniref:uncharacterized protein LOC122076566 isoform X1 n=1 Tax=Macadamia integrifolia TaxID=60698 RepID=UPI001C4ED257|nr:uncharacterized protein LOC122076566 isoform X1 [Macadamia integrifolia]XP_042497866.1 uncharacterized protein LOC122076566 isoform X1 [Macadamia integrifolia]XP_042497867.1 uncharacterized protein LOC122076566 isoform X1 [Macadamia integrifolia]XP_042497868.1 uncharacterized protein LOC122076566 isoform X1 [Macadamia integrifolia]XP_042497869.1 uncharacterized protein LOC122076566 isoform X1 [Macadamia integrifolia]